MNDRHAGEAVIFSQIQTPVLCCFPLLFSSLRSVPLAACFL